MTTDKLRSPSPGSSSEASTVAPSPLSTPSQTPRGSRHSTPRARREAKDVHSIPVFDIRSPSPRCVRSMAGRSMSPPGAPRPSWRLLRALRGERLDVLRALLSEEPQAAITPIFDGLRFEMPIVKAARLGCSPCILKLLGECGASANSSSSDEPSPLMALATGNGARAELWMGVIELDILSQITVEDETRRIRAARCFLRAGADPDECDALGQSPADVAEVFGRTRLAEVLRYTKDARNVKMLQKMWSRHAANQAAERGLLALRAIAQAEVISFLVPTNHFILDGGNASNSKVLQLPIFEDPPEPSKA